MSKKYNTKYYGEEDTPYTEDIWGETVTMDDSDDKIAECIEKARVSYRNAYYTYLRESRESSDFFIALERN